MTDLKQQARELLNEMLERQAEAQTFDPVTTPAHWDDEKAFWINKAEHLGLRLYSWTNKTRAVFIIPKTQAQIHLYAEDWDTLIENTPDQRPGPPSS